MRNYFKAALVLVLLSSCEQEADYSSNSLHDIPGNTRISAAAANSQNPYDDAGMLYCDILEEYLTVECDSMPADTIYSKVLAITNQDLRFIAIKTSAYAKPSLIRIGQILDNPALSQAAILSNCGLGTMAQVNLQDFLDDVLNLCDTDADFDDAFSFIKNYEASVEADTTFSAAEKRVLLINASIARYGYYLCVKYKKRKPRDRDWDHLITTLTAGIEGMGSDTATAIANAAVCAAIANQ